MQNERPKKSIFFIKKKWKTGLPVLLFLGLAGILSAQSAHQFNTWFSYSGVHPITAKLGVHTDFQYRRSDFLKESMQSVVRVGLELSLPKNMALTGGYAWALTYPYGEYPLEVRTIEHRIWEQFAMSQHTGRFYFNHRYRFEQRFVENASFDTLSNKKVVDGYKFKQRVRYRFIVSVPLNHKEIIDKTLFLWASADAFMGFGKGTKRNTLDQSRLLAGLGWRFDKNINIQLGYMNQRLFKSDGRNEYNNTVQLGLAWNIDFRKRPDN